MMHSVKHRAGSLLVLIFFLAVVPFVDQEAAAQSAGTKLWAFQTPHRIYSSPAIGLDGSLYFGCLDYRVYGLTAAGTKRWDFLTENAVISSPAIGADETVYVGSLDGRLYAFSPFGTKKWGYTTGAELHSSPAIGLDGTVYIGSMDGKLHAVTPQGTQKWIFTGAGPIYSSAAIGPDGTIYFGSRDYHLYAVGPDGQLRWKFATGNWVDSSPAITTLGLICFGSLDGIIYALNPTGTPRWAATNGLPNYGSPAVGPDGTIYFGSADGKLNALQPDGAPKWSAALDGIVSYSSPAVTADGTVYIGCADGRLYAFKNDGSRRWTFAAADSMAIPSPTVGKDGIVYVGSNDGRLYALKGSAGPAPGPWPQFRRDPRHSASGFVQRQLPAGYSPGAKVTVALEATPPPSAPFYLVEDIVPANWQVSQVSHDGSFDAAARKVKFGPFYDSLPRTLTYTVTPPLTETGQKQFDGLSIVDGADRLVGGLQTVELIPLHPADNAPVDGWLTLTELTAYSAAWKKGSNPIIPPSPIPPAFVSKAVELWTQGEQYQLTTNYTAPPLWWVPTGLAGEEPPPSSYLNTTTNGTAVAEMPGSYQPGQPFTVTLIIAPNTNITVYAIEEQLPPGWTASSISDNGFFDLLRQKLKWGPFFDHTPRSLSYQVVPPADALSSVEFVGFSSFDGATVRATGRRQIASTLQIQAAIERKLPPGYSPAAEFEVELQAYPDSDTFFYTVEDSPPANWQISAISHNGYFDAANRKVRFGPFFDNAVRILRYTVKPPAGENGPKQFTGSANINGLDQTIGGDELVEFIPLHPADTNPVDSRLTLGEMTAYGAAWKRGITWPMPPTSIPPHFLNRAVALWKEGEAYLFSSSVTNAPLWWVSQPTATPSPFNPALPLAATNGSALALLPKSFAPESPLQIRIAISAASHIVVYGVEDRPPDGWSVGAITESGFFDPVQRKVKWGPFFDANPRQLAYEALPPANATNAVVLFQGAAAFDNSVIQIGGTRRSYATLIPPELHLQGLTPGAGLELILTGQPAEFYRVEMSTNLVDWTLLTTLTNITGTVRIEDKSAADANARFYRVVWP